MQERAICGAACVLPRKPSGAASVFFVDFAKSGGGPRVFGGGTCVFVRFTWKMSYGFCASPENLWRTWFSSYKIQIWGYIFNNRLIIDFEFFF